MRMMHMTAPGPPEVLKPAERPDPVPGRGRALIGVEVAGVILMDAWFRAGKFPAGLPFTPGFEVGGRVLAVGDPGDDALVGQRVVAGTGGSGGYSDRAEVEVGEVFPIPDGLGTEAAVGVFQSGRTAIGLTRIAQVLRGETVLITAAAGSTGTLLLQLARTAGARTVIAAASGGKAAVLKRLGADAVADYTAPDWADHVRAATEGRGADVTFECVGGEIGRQAWQCTARGGRFVPYGWASGQGTVLTTDQLAMGGITVISGLGVPAAADVRRRDAERALAEAAAGRLTAEIGGRFPLAEAARAHALIESRRTTGKLLLLP